MNEFNALLRNLKEFPDITMIGRLTILAQEMRKSSGTEIISAIVNYFGEVSSNNPTYRVPIIYAIDAILRSGKKQYVKPFSKLIAGIFEAAFVGGNDLDK